MNIWQRIVLYLVSVIVGAVLFSIIPFMGNAIIENDRDSRIRDYEIQQTVNKHYTEIKVDLAKIQSKMGIDGS